MNKDLSNNLKILNLIYELNNNDEFLINVLDKREFNNLKNIITSRHYLYYLNSKGYKKILRFVNCLKNKELLEKFNKCNIFDEERIPSSYEEINEKQILNSNYYISKDLLLKTEFDLLDYLLNDSEIKYNNYAMPYIIISFINRYHNKINIEIINKLLTILKSCTTIDFYQVYDYVNINLINDIYTNVDIENMDFYTLVINFINELKKRNDDFYDQNNKLISHSINSNTKIILDDEILKKLPSVINVLVSSSHFCFCLTEDDINKLYDIINCYRFDYIKNDNLQFYFCNKIIGKLNNLNSFLCNLDKENYNNYILQLIFNKELYDITKLFNKKLIKVKNFDPQELYEIHVADKILLLYLNDPEIIEAIPVFKEYLYCNSTIDLSILYLLNRHLNILTKANIEDLKSLINIRINNKHNIENDNFKYKKGYVKTLKYIYNIIDNYIVF